MIFLGNKLNILLIYSKILLELIILMMRKEMNESVLKGKKLYFFIVLFISNYFVIEKVKLYENWKEINVCFFKDNDGKRG